MIKGTNCNCKVKDIKITNTTAYITVTFYSQLHAEHNKAFQFYIKDSEDISLLNNNYYWIDRNNNYNNDTSNIDINLYKDIILEVDITNSNKADMIETRWCRSIQLILKDTTTNSSCWYSETINLISKDIELPTITELDISSDKDYTLNVRFKYNYKSQQDFNYNNINLYTEINVRSLYTEAILETVTIQDESINSYINASFLNSYSSTVFVEIVLKNNLGTTLLRRKEIYKPIIKDNNTYIKIKGKCYKAFKVHVSDDYNYVSYQGLKVKTGKIGEFNAFRNNLNTYTFKATNKNVVFDIYVNDVYYRTVSVDTTVNMVYAPSWNSETINTFSYIPKKLIDNVLIEGPLLTVNCYITACSNTRYCSTKFLCNN